MVFGPIVDIGSSFLKGFVLDFKSNIRHKILRLEKAMGTVSFNIGRRKFVQGIALGVAGLAAAKFTAAQPGVFPAIVTPDWLVQHLGDSRLVVIDIRTPEQYKKGHIPGAVNVPMALWAVSRDGLSMELPPEDALRDLIGKSGINVDSRLVVVNRIETDFSRADAARVAWTCTFAGIRNSAVLDGGYNRWQREIKSTSIEHVNPKPGAYTGKMNNAMVASKTYVLSRIGKSIIADTRLPEDYFGIASKPGHIKDSIDLPTPWIFLENGTFRKEEDLRAMAAGVLGANRSREIILYCGVGGFASTWAFLLTRLLGYKNVKVYDGSMEEWAKDPTNPVSAYTWR